MKKNLVFLLVTLVSVQVFAGQKLPILTYGDYSPMEVERFAKGTSNLARQFKSLLLAKTGESSVEALFQKVTVKTVTLEAGTYENSCWNTDTKVIEFFPGKQFTGKVAVYNNGSKEIILFKCACANVLNVMSRIVNDDGGLNDEDLPYQETTTQIQTVQQPQTVPATVVVQQQPQQIVVVRESGNYYGGYYTGYSSYRNYYYSRPVVIQQPIVIRNNIGYTSPSYRGTSGYTTGYSSGSSYQGTMSGGRSGYSSGSSSSGRGTMSGGGSSSSGSSRGGGGRAR